MNLVLVTGSRNWQDFNAIFDRLAAEPAHTIVLQGGASGADTMAKKAAFALGFMPLTLDANWATYKLAAGPIRNRAMLDLKPTKVLAFCRNHSKGTMDCVNEARMRGIPTEVIEA